MGPMPSVGGGSCLAHSASPPGTWPSPSWKLQGHTPCKPQPEPGALDCRPPAPSPYHPRGSLPSPASLVCSPCLLLLDSWPLRVRTLRRSDPGRVLWSQHCTRGRNVLGFPQNMTEGVPMGATARLAPRAFGFPSNILFWPHHCSFSLLCCWFCFHDVAFFIIFPLWGQTMRATSGPDQHISRKSWTWSRMK